MNSIFLRIYGGMLVAILVIGAFSYAGVQVANSYRADSYREQMARGTFYLMALGLQRQKTPAELTRWRQVLGRLMAADIEMLRASDMMARVSDTEIERLSRGRVVIRLNEDEGNADIYFQLPGEERYLATRMTRVSEQQARATALLILDELSQYPSDSWPEQFARMQQHFGFALDSVPYSSLRLDREQLQRLERREVVIAIDDSARGSQSAVTVYAPIGSTGEVLQIGPLKLFEHYPIEMLALVGTLGLSAMGIATYLLVRPLQTRLQGLGRAVEQLGSGDLNAQAEVQTYDAIGQLASTFNGMAEHIRRLIQSQREMTRAVSHELRTPVARLRFGIEMLAEADDLQQRRKLLSDLDSDIDQLDELIDEILTFARLEEGAPQIEFEDVDIPQLIERICGELAPLAGNIGLRGDPAQVSMVAHEYRHAVGAERYLHRILQNLVTNALRYAASRVELRYYVDGDLAVIEVDDDGPGIPEGDRNRVFKPFARLDESRQRKSGGYGLGLSIVQRIVEWHGGHIEVRESPWGGARFRMSWPRLRQAGGSVLAG